MYQSISVNIGRMYKLPNGRHLLSGDVCLYIYNGKKHREKGPAEINNRTGYRAWYKNGILDNKKGPAVIDPIKGYKEYWENGKMLRRENL